MKVLGILCAWFGMCLSQGESSPFDVHAIDLSMFPGCVSQNEDTISGDVPPRHMKYKRTAVHETDESELYSDFISAIINNTMSEHESGDTFYVTFTAYFEFNQGVYEQLAAAVLCKEDFKSANNKCRNRTYFFFSEIPPAEMAEILLNDIGQHEPLVRKCLFPEASR